MNEIPLARRALMFTHQPTARRVLVDWFADFNRRFNEDMRQRRDVYEAHVQAALPTLSPEDAQIVAAVWENAKAFLDAETDEEREAINTAGKRFEQHTNIWWPVLRVLFDEFDAATPQILTDDELVRLHEVAGPVMEWWRDYEQP